MEFPTSFKFYSSACGTLINPSGLSDGVLQVQTLTTTTIYLNSYANGANHSDPCYIICIGY